MTSMASGEVGVLGEEPVAGMHTVGAAALDGVEDLVGLEVAVGRSLATQRVGLIGEADVQRVAVEVAVDGDGGDTHFLARTDDTDGDFAAISDENLCEHDIWLQR
jgi:hypothetical protein